MEKFRKPLYNSTEFVFTIKSNRSEIQSFWFEGLSYWGFLCQMIQIYIVFRGDFAYQFRKSKRTAIGFSIMNSSSGISMRLNSYLYIINNAHLLIAGYFFIVIMLTIAIVMGDKAYFTVSILSVHF
jgi:hypothetical protein